MAILSISTEFGTGALEISQVLKRLLDYECVTLGRLLTETKQVAKEMSLYMATERKKSLCKWSGNEFISFAALLQGAILDHALKDNVILLTRGSNYLVKEIPHALRIRIVAPLTYRIERIMRIEGVSYETARLLVKQADREIDCTIQMVYGEDWDDPEAYDVKFNTSTQSLEEITEIVKNLLKSKDSMKTEEAQNILQMRALAAKVKAKVVSVMGFYASTLEMKFKGNGIILRGVVCSKAKQKKIEKEILKISGSVPLICELSCLTRMMGKMH